MGFGSYDESEQKDQDVNTDEDTGVEVDGGESGELSFEGTDSTSELVDQLQDMKEDDE